MSNNEIIANDKKMISKKSGSFLLNQIKFKAWLVLAAYVAMASLPDNYFYFILTFFMNYYQTAFVILATNFSIIIITNATKGIVIPMRKRTIVFR